MFTVDTATPEAIILGYQARIEGQTLRIAALGRNIEDLNGQIDARDAEIKRLEMIAAALAPAASQPMKEGV
jgi:hypothetical protein